MVLAVEAEDVLLRRRLCGPTAPPHSKFYAYGTPALGMRNDTREPVPRSRRLTDEGVGSESGRRRVGAASEALA